MTSLRASWDALSATYWFVPSVMVAGALALSAGMVQLDRATGAPLLDRLSWAYTGGPEGARAVLSTIAASMITVAGVTFSITIVALTLASQQFGPRLLRNFLRDRGNQIVLGTFVSTFVYCLMVLRTVRGGEGSEFVPNLSVSTGVLLALFSLGVLIYFIHHVSVSIQASQIIANVADDLEEVIDDMFPQRIGEGERPAPAEPPSAGDDTSEPVPSRSSGYVQAIDGARLMEAAVARDLVVRIEARPGTFVREGSTLLRVSGGRTADDRSDALRGAFVIGADRTGTQDVLFFVEQLVELALRALSPGVNDPGTAQMCLDRLEQTLCRFASRVWPSPLRFDDAGALRVIAEPVAFEEVARAAFDEIGRHGRHSVVVTCHLLRVIASVSSCTARVDDRRALARLAASTAERAREAIAEEADRRRVEACARAAQSAFDAGATS
ncbi:MAG TPA: DUF2254 domain-containing protein [Longimicrobiales bacterium]|nr:DUF2254 domain-containing protein [Longimicrobiales bacterium]